MISDDLNPINITIGAVMKEIARRAELRDSLEAERGRPIDDVEFLKIAEQGGLRI